MGSRMTLTEKQWVKGRVAAEFEPIINGLRDRLIPLKHKFTEKLYKSLGLAAAEKKILKLVRELETLNSQFKEVAGVECVDITIKSRPGRKEPGSYGANRWDGTPFSRQVEAEVKATKEARHLVEAEAECKRMKDEVMLAGFPEQLTELIQKELPKATGRFAKLAGVNGNGRRQLGA